MSVWEAVFWGGFSAGSLYIGQALAGPLGRAPRATGLIMGFGAGALLSAVAYELIPEPVYELGIGMSFLLGALTYYLGDRLIEHFGGEQRQQISGEADDGSGVAMFLGALLDGLPEAFIIGITFALGGSVSVAFVAAVFMSNIPEGLAGTISFKAAGYTGRHVAGMWGTLLIAGAIAAGLGFLLADEVPNEGLYANAFAAGAVLTMLADSMMPEAFKHGGRTVGLLTVFGYLMTSVFTAIE